jgi:mono/diheme cytochrome c family protein
MTMPMRTRVTLGIALAACGVALAPLRAFAQAAPVSQPTPTKATSGPQIYSSTCAACHQATGAGLPERYPPLAGSEIATGDPERVIRIVLGGLTGEVEVQGETFNGAMPGWGPTLTDAQIAAVLTYVRGTWGNAAPAITTAKVAQVRALTASRKTPWTIAELAQVPPKVTK